MAGAMETGGTAPLGLRSGALWRFVPRDCALEPTTGRWLARTGQRGTWSRGATLANVQASDGATYTAPATMPGLDGRQVLGQPSLNLLMGLEDALTFPVTWWPQALTGWIRFFETGIRTTADATLLAVSPVDPASGTRCWLDTSGTYYGAVVSNGGGTATARLTSGQPTAGQLVDLVWQWSAAGVTIAQAINNGSPTTAASGAVTMPTGTFDAGTAVRLNRRGATANPASQVFVEAAIWPGLLTMDQIRGAW